MLSPPNFSTVRFTTCRIVKAHRRHFLTLSVLFLLPVAFSLIVFPILQNLLLQTTHINSPTLLDHSYPDDPLPFEGQPLTLILTYAIFVLTFSICAVSSISYSAFHGFHGRPVKLISSFQSILTSFLPLFATTVVSGIIVSGVLLILGIFSFLVVKIVKIAGFDQFENFSRYSTIFSLVILTVLLLILLPFQVNWGLSSAIVVVESSWGFQPLKRSANLIKGSRWVALSLSSTISIFSGLFIVCNYNWINMYIRSNPDAWKSWAVIFNIVLNTTMVMIMFEGYIVANTVMYMYSRAVHGEISMEIDDEGFAKEYVSLPSDDDYKVVPRLVSVVAYN